MHQGIVMSNPLWPSAYDGLWSALIGLISVLMFAALFDVMRRATPLRAVEWVALIVLVPVVGPGLWFIYGRSRFPDRR